MLIDESEMKAALLGPTVRLHPGEGTDERGLAVVDVTDDDDFELFSWRRSLSHTVNHM